jgi:hypothetical protein
VPLVSSRRGLAGPQRGASLFQAWVRGTTSSLAAWATVGDAQHEAPVILSGSRVALTRSCDSQPPRPRESGRSRRCAGRQRTPTQGPLAPIGCAFHTRSSRKRTLGPRGASKFRHSRQLQRMKLCVAGIGRNSPGAAGVSLWIGQEYPVGRFQEMTISELRAELAQVEAAIAPHASSPDPDVARWLAQRMGASSRAGEAGTGNRAGAASTRLGSARRHQHGGGPLAVTGL